jgi:hypothetical protein
VTDEAVRGLHAGHLEEVVQLGDDGGAGNRCCGGDGVAASPLVLVDRRRVDPFAVLLHGGHVGPGPVVGADSREAGDALGDRRRVAAGHLPDVGGVAEARQEHNRRATGAVTLQVEGPAAPDIDGGGDVGAGRGRRAGGRRAGVGAEVQAAVVRTASRPNAHRNRALGMVPRC